MNRFRDLEGIHGIINVLDLDVARLPARSPRFQLNDLLMYRM